MRERRLDRSQYYAAANMNEFSFTCMLLWCKAKEGIGRGEENKHIYSEQKNSRTPSILERAYMALTMQFSDAPVMLTAQFTQHQFATTRVGFQNDRRPNADTGRTVNSRYRRTLGTPKRCACNVIEPVTRIRVTGTYVPVTRESQNFAFRVRNLRLPCR